MAVFVHEPVMGTQVVEVLSRNQPRLIVDCTVGGGGHAGRLLEACPHARLLGLDRDPQAVAAARRSLTPWGERVRVRHAPFSSLEAELAQLGEAHADVLLADLGVSSHQLDTPGRGFSFQDDGPLDMRMDPSQEVAAHHLLARMSERELALALARFGEERRARAVARALVKARPQSTKELAAVVCQVVRPDASGLHPATRTFQALRILVNRELDELAALLEAIPRVLRAGGTAAIISFHSLEDRAVKQAFRKEARACVCPPQLPVCGCNHHATLEVLTPKPLRPCVDEIAKNPRARSARLRAARRLEGAS